MQRQEGEQPEGPLGLAPTPLDLEEAATLLATSEDSRLGFLQAARRLARCEVALLWEPTPAGVVLTAAVGAAIAPDAEPVPWTARHAAVAALRGNRRVLAPLAVGHPDVDQPELDALAVQAVLAEPIPGREEPMGALMLGWGRPVTRVESMALGYLRLLCAQAGVALERAAAAANLHEQARTDPLTGLPNRRSLFEHLRREVAKSRRSGRSLALAVLDLDEFKAYNDRYGHAAGDQLLIDWADGWQEALRTGDLLARYGGEEFVLVLHDCGDVDTAAAAADRIRRAGPPGATASAGVALLGAEEPVRELLRRADQALYDAKAAGRDRTVLAEILEEEGGEDDEPPAPEGSGPSPGPLV